MKRVFNESFSAPSKTPWQVQSDLSYDLRLERYSDLRGHSMYIATRRAHLEAREAGFLVHYKKKYIILNQPGTQCTFFCIFFAICHYVNEIGQKIEQNEGGIFLP